MIAFDVLEPLPRIRTGNKFIIVASDLLTKCVVLRAQPEQTAIVVTKFHLYDIFLRYSLPFKVLNNQDTPFINRLVKEMHRLLNVKQ